MKYKDWLNEWLTYYVKPVAKERTKEKYRGQIENHIVPVLGEYELEALSAQTLQHFTVELIQNGFAANTINGVVSILKSSLKSAVALGVTNAQYTDAIVRPKAKEKRVECFSKDEQRKIERYIAERATTNCSELCCACIRGCALVSCLHSHGKT